MRSRALVSSAARAPWHAAWGRAASAGARWPPRAPPWPPPRVPPAALRSRATHADLAHTPCESNHFVPLQHAGPSTPPPGVAELLQALDHVVAAAGAPPGAASAPLRELRAASAALRRQLRHAPVGAADGTADAVYLDEQFYTAITRLMASHHLSVAGHVLIQLAALARAGLHAAHSDTREALSLALLDRLCHDPDAASHVDVAAVFDAHCALHTLPASTTYAPAVRALLRRLQVGAAARMLRRPIAYYWTTEYGSAGASSPAEPRRPSRALLHNLMVALRVTHRVLRSDGRTAPGHVPASPALLLEYSEALAALGALMQANCVPLPYEDRGNAAALIKALYTLPELVARWRPHLSREQRSALRRRERAVAGVLPRLVSRLPAGASEPSPTGFFTHAARRPSAGARRDRQRFFAPVLPEPAYNALVHYALHYANKPHWARQVLEHMAHIRTPALLPSQVTVNILVREATRRRLDSLAAYALELGAMLRGAPGPVPGTEAAPPAAPLLDNGTAEAPPAPYATLPEARLLAHLERAAQENDTFQLVALLQHITVQRLRNGARPDGVRPASVLARLYPRLLLRRGRSRCSPHAQSAVCDPHVLSAVLQLAAAACDPRLAVRVWQLLKHASHSSELRPHTWPVPVQAATTLMQMLVRCSAVRAARAPTARARWQQWRQVRTVGAEEYEWLVRHWGLSPLLREEHSVVGRLPDARAHVDAQFYVALLRLLRRTAPHGASWAHAARADAALALVVRDIHRLGLADALPLHMAMRAAIRVAPGVVRRQAVPGAGRARAPRRAVPDEIPKRA